MTTDFFKQTVARRYDPRDLQGFETSAGAVDQKHQLIDVLFATGYKDSELFALLSKCRKGNRCRSAACPTCLRRFRIIWCSWVAQYIDEDLTRWTVASIVPADLAYPLGELDRFDSAHAKDRLRKQLARSEIRRAQAVGGFDYAVQEFEDRAPKWRPHIYLLISACRPYVKQALKRHYPQDADTRVPLVVKPLEENASTAIKVATYSFKSDFYKREPDFDSLGNADTSHSELGPDHQAELALYLHSQGFFGRTIRRGNSQEFHKLRTR